MPAAKKTAPRKRAAAKNKAILTPQREAFAAGLARGMTQSAAYREAFPKSQDWVDATVWRKASLLAQNGDVQARVEELQRKAAAANEVTVERVLKEVARLAFVDLRKAYNEDGTLKKPTEMDDDTAAALAGIDVSSAHMGDVEDAGTLITKKLKTFDKKGALELCMRHLGMLNDKLTVDATVKGAVSYRANMPARGG